MIDETEGTNPDDGDGEMQDKDENESITIPETGDETYLLLYLLALLIAPIGLILIRKGNKNANYK